MHILVTNDDGVTAPGLLALVKEMRRIGKISVLAPDRNWSASGHVKTMDRPLRVREVRLADDTPAFATDGAPSDCVALAILGFLPDKIDIVVSGINPNPNLGHDVTYSGTVTAAMEAVIWSIPGMAFSLDNPENPVDELDYGTAARVAARLVSKWVAASPDAQLPTDTLLNINIPYLPDDQIKGIRITRQGLRVYLDKLVSREDPRGRPYYWIGGDAPTGIAEKGTDIGALADGFVSVTPLKLDLTDYQALENLSAINWDQGMSNTKR